MPFEKGKSGNPGGKPKQREEFVKACRGASLAIFQMLMVLAKNEDEAAKDRIKAMELILAYGLGKPAVVDFEGNTQPESVAIVIHSDALEE